MRYILYQRNYSKNYDIYDTKTNSISNESSQFIEIVWDSLKNDSFILKEDKLRLYKKHAIFIAEFDSIDQLKYNYPELFI